MHSLERELIVTEMHQSSARFHVRSDAAVRLEPVRPELGVPAFARTCRLHRSAPIASQGLIGFQKPEVHGTAVVVEQYLDHAKSHVNRTQEAGGRIVSGVCAIRRSPVVVIASSEDVLDMDENRCREASARAPVSCRDHSRLEGQTPASAEDPLRRQARAAIRAGMLPRQPQVSVWGGPGAGASCAVCGSTVARDGHGFELEFRDAMGQLERRYVHIPCFAAWDSECRSLLQADSNSGTISDRERLEP
jgi:hypothetical protein